MKSLIERLQKNLAKPLPYSSQSRNFAPKNEQVRLCAVMIALYADQNEIFVPLMVRPSEKNDVHSGQISLPGGGKETQDHDLLETAIRETFEEIGVIISKKDVLGNLSDIYIPPSKSLVTPYVAILDEKPSYQANKNEVAKMLDIRLNDLANPKNQRTEDYKLATGVSYQMPAYHIEGYRIWGATARILSELLILVD